MGDEQQNKERDLFGQMVGATMDAIDGAVDATKGAFDGAVDATMGALDGASDAFDQVLESLPTFDEVVAQAVRLPGTGVDRSEYLTKALGRKHAPRVVQAAIDTTPARAGLTQKQIARAAKNSIARDGRRTTALSFAAGIPGGIAGAVTIPADMIQFYGYLIRTIQKLTYLYGWRDLVHIEEGTADRAASRALLVFLGVMGDVKRADKVFKQLATRRIAGASDQVLRSMMLMGGFDDDLEEISVELGKKMARRLTGQVAGKTVPVVGGIVSGVLTNTGYGDMSKRLLKELQRYM